MSDGARHRSATIRPNLVLPAPARPRLPHFVPRSTSPTPTPTHPTTPTQHTARIRQHLAHLLPRHAAFTVAVTLHQLHNVPLVHGEFGLKWKIKGVTSHSGTGILDKVKSRKAKSKLSPAKGSDTDNASLFDAASASDAHSIANSSSTHSASGHPVPAVVVSANDSPVSRSFSGASVSTASSTSSASPRANGLSPPGYLSAEWSRRHDTDSHSSDDRAKSHYSPAKGITSFVKLREHTVIWEQTLKFVVQMGVARDSRELGDCLAKFVVMQRVVSGDPDAPRNPRLGAVYLNLAQYVDAGIITRRYLLRQSKTNATLKLTIHVEHTAGETTYVAPPLPKAEILSGVAGLLESSDVYRTRPRASDLYTHSSSSSDDAGVASGSDSSSIVSGSGASHGPSQSQHGRSSRHKHRRPFEISKLPTITDPRGTEKLIEALFNPVPVTQPSKVTPFTYLVEVDEEGERSSDRADLRDEARQGKTDGEADDDGSLYADSQDECAGEMGSEYHSLRSHPSFPGSLQSKRSVHSLATKGRDEEAVSTVAQPGVQLTERRTWWQKVLSSPNIG